MNTAEKMERQERRKDPRHRGSVRAGLVQEHHRRHVHLTGRPTLRFAGITSGAPRAAPSGAAISSALRRGHASVT